MTNDYARAQIQSRAKEYLKPDASGKGFICPVCGSGSGNHGTGITTKDGVHFTCWAGCYTSSDIIDIIGLENGLTDYISKLRAAAQALGIALDEGKPAPSREPKAKPAEPAKPALAADDYKDLFLSAAGNIGGTDYHRGISLETLNRFKIGFIPAWTHPKAPNAPPSPRLIIPTSRSSYLARDTRADLTEEQSKYKISKVGRVQIFNSKALQGSTKPIFVVEGELDALSIIDAGGEAVALGSVANRTLFIKMLEENAPAQPLLVAMDNDDAGNKARQELETGLKRLKIPFYTVDISAPYKDANEALNMDREAFLQAVAKAENTEDAILEEEAAALKKESAAYSLPDFLKNIEQSKHAAYIPTGFAPLDTLLDGGLYAGLYVVGAISSLGKTTFCLQIADQIAAAGHDVLVFSLEMARNELMAKSISRLTLLEDMEKQASTAHAKTTRGILTGSRYAGYSQIERNVIQAAVTAYGQYAGNIYITEGIGNVGVAEIKSKVEKHIHLTGKRPVIVVDYLQIIAPADIRATDKQNTDKAVLELKRISRDCGIPVVGISSFNRDNYTAPVNLTSFKESGAIEYSSDVLIGLQYAGMDYQDGETDKVREKRIRGLIKDTIESGKKGEAQEIQVKILKNRNGSKGDALLDFYPMFNYFTVGEGIEEDDEVWS